MFVLAHLSDPHLGPLPRVTLSDLAGKRALGFLNWQRKRHKMHRRDAVDAIAGDIRAQPHDHVAITGDLVNIALEDEFPAALAWLDTLGAPEDVTLVPGNHDAYVRATHLRALHHWGGHMRGDDAEHPRDMDAPFPFVRRRGPVALIGLSSAIPTQPFMATGRLGAPQLHRLSQALRHLAREELFRIVLIHHPPLLTPGGRFKQLLDSERLRKVLQDDGAELVLHGHDHVHSVAWLEGPHRRIPAVGVPSASAIATSLHGPAAYNLYEIGGKPGHWRCEAISRGLRPGRDGVSELTRRTLIGIQG